MNVDPAGLVVGFLAGLIATGIVAYILYRRASAAQRAEVERSLAATEHSQQLLLDAVKREFSALSREALSANADDFLKLAGTRFEQQSERAEKHLDVKKQLIDARLEDMTARLQRLDGMLQTTDKQRAESHAALRAELERSTRATNLLSETTTHLRTALANPQRRGQWGERMAEDVLRLAGFVQGVNYYKQQGSAGQRPDFTFPLPGGHKVNMDVKFPLANYLRMLESKDDVSAGGFRAAFLKDVRGRVREVTTREYIDAAAGTVDYVLVFIPNERIYGFIHEHDANLLDDALRQKVVLCSPLSLYAILAVIRQAVENFRLQESARDILSLLADFKKQWTKYVETMEKMGHRLEDAMKQYGELTGTRTRQLDRQLDRIDALQVEVADGESPQRQASPPQLARTPTR